MAQLLLIETSSESASVCLTLNEQILAIRFSEQKNDSSSKLVRYIKDMLDTSGISGGKPDAIAVSIGPGSYTGLRVGLSTAKGLCYSWNVPLLAINTLDMMASAMIQEVQSGVLSPDGSLHLSTERHMSDLVLCPMIDARRMEVYTAAFDLDAKLLASYSATIIDPEFGSEWKDRPVCLFGSGAAKAFQLLRSNPYIWEEPYKPSAAHLLELAVKKYEGRDYADLAYSEPFYLKLFFAPNQGV